MAHVVSGGDPNPLTRILQRFDLQPNAIAIATLPLGALSVEFVSFTEARDSPRVFQRHRAIIKKASRKLRVSEAEIFRRLKRLPTKFLIHGIIQTAEATSEAPVKTLYPMSHHAAPQPALRCLAELGRA